MRKLRVGIIGAGQIAQVAHIPGYLSRPNEVEIVALSDLIKEKADSVASKYSIPHVFADYREMLRQCELDVVSVCTPNKFHAEATIAALQAGAHVLCEKPPALTEEDAKMMADTAKERNKILTFNFHYRFSAEVEALKRIIDAGELGEIYAARVLALRRRGIPGWGVFTNKEIQGGGPLIDIGIHMLDTALYLMGDPEPELLMGVTHTRIGNRPGVGLMGSWDPEKFTVEDAAMGMIRFKNSASLVLETSFALNMKEKSVMNVFLYGDRGGAELFPLSLHLEKGGYLMDTELPFLPDVNKYERSIHHFIDCCLYGRTPLVTPEQGLLVQRIINGLYDSAQSGMAVRF
ncbi:putative oxidoreductase, NADH-binding [[Clostridium] ultunense Esp]|uniref:Gfo/Idh/MocA family protein n=1 Tax=Thermicanus aegyptius TaxID=94009 RepID=UPI0002B706BC|nr:putative oxidoreductase, NADH-binding [[Clostridium] ultunense Esp]